MKFIDIIKEELLGKTIDISNFSLEYEEGMSIHPVKDGMFKTKFAKIFNVYDTSTHEEFILGINAQIEDKIILFELSDDDDIIYAKDGDIKIDFDDLVGLSINSMEMENTIVVLKTNNGNYGIAPSGGAIPEYEADAMLPSTIKTYTFDGFELLLCLESGEELYIADDTGGEGLECWKIK